MKTHLPRSSYASTSAALALLCSLVLTSACEPPDPGESAGGMVLGLTTEASGVTYRLRDARFTLEGPEKRELAAMGEDALELELAQGAYRLTLLPGYALARQDDPAGTRVEAKLVSQNPAPVIVRAGERTKVALRFELAGGLQATTSGAGTLEVAIEVTSQDAGTPSDDCARHLRINELDYEQASTDETEFVELLNTGSCSAALQDLTLELVNGSDGKPYASYVLGEAGTVLAAGERLVLGDPALLALLPPSTARLTLKGSGLQNGPDGVRLRRGEQVIDALAYGDVVPGLVAGKPTPSDDGELALGRCPDGFDTDEGATDVRAIEKTPGLANSCEAAQNRSATMPSSMSQR